MKYIQSYSSEKSSKYVIIIIHLLYYINKLFCKLIVKYRNTNNANNNKIYFGSGCFWCTEAIFEDVKGVKKVVSGYAGGNIENPTYNQVTSQKTNHAEVCMIEYNNKIISLQELLEIFFLLSDFYHSTL